jgi:hypothetical protein
MRLRWEGLAALILLSGSCAYQAADGMSPAQERVQVSVRSDNDLIRHLRLVLADSKLAARINYRLQVCRDQIYDPFPVPQIRVKSPSENAVGLTAIREIVSGHRNVSVTEKSAGLIGVTIGNVPDSILRTTITHLTFSPDAQYNGIDAVGAIENNPEVQAAMRRLDIHIAPTFIDHLVAPPDPTMPHLPASMRNLTVDEALDAVARTFGGIILYGACTNPPLFVIGFADIIRRAK